MPRAISHEEKINYMRISAGIAGMGFSNKHLDLLVCLYELVTEKRGDSNLMDVCKLEALVEQREAERIKEKK
jgi:hypothetical protein